jgi:hypothetical protein
MPRFAGRLAFWCAILLLGCAKPVKEKQDAAPNEEAKSSGVDAEAAECLAKKDSIAEAKAWLAAPKHALWKGDRKEITALVDDFYKAGAKEVYAVDIAKEPGFEIVAQFVVVLPTDPEARRKVLEVHNAFWKKYLDEDPDEVKDFLVDEAGQRYLLLNFDL